MSDPGFDLDALRREEFPWATEDVVYLNNASTGPLPRRTVDATTSWAQLRTNPQRITQDLQFGTLARGRELIAEMVNAQPAEIALATNTSYGINLAAFALPLQAGDVVLAPEQEFPANVYPWMQLAARRGVEYRMLDCGGEPLSVDRLRKELEDDRVRAVALSWVQFASGVRADLDALGALCRERGVFFVVDAIQGVGPLTIDLSATPVDVFSCGAQKWLLSPWGSAFVYVRRELIERLEPHDVSWLGVKGSDDFSRLTDYDLKWRPDARRFEFITLPYQDYAGMNASLELIKEIGYENVSRHALSLARRIVDWAKTRDDVELVTPESSAHRAAIVSIRPSAARAVSDRLNAAGVAHSLREGAIRFSPYFYNTAEEVDRALEIMGA